MQFSNFTAALAITAGLSIAAPAWSQTADTATTPAEPEATSADASADSTETDADAPKQILFIGNSYFYYNDSLHNHTRRMAGEASGIDIDDLDYRSITISGGSLDMHPIDHYLTPGAIGYDEPFDLVILQGNSAAAETEARSTRFHDAVVAMDEKIKATGAKTALYMTHAYAEGHEDYTPDGTEKLDKLYTDTGAEIGATVIPVGLAFAEAKRQRPELELQQDFDHSHPTLAGTYLASAVTYATLYGKNPVGLEYDYFGRLPAEDAAFLQQVAEETVKAYQAR
ncbi:hypothetical protein FQV27_09755 [Paracoccus aurantiacus]|uniref:SGNH/GDSL hydrolase family protein n=1 Tax=Paracoccus aurantiacus TaxID=2599412 RepID=A0A5C6S432_9RHOB|nr:DUF4886 domain-containing protein [Paracoccus aurantiacus]TXB69236.1 hypothetical protein FQV27_09755 [Paracoccus aurantiacus]